MRLFEVLEPGSLKTVLMNLIDQANNKGETLALPFSALSRMIGGDELGISTVAVLKAWKNEYDKDDQIIAAIVDNPQNPNDAKIIMATDKPHAEKNQALDQGNAPSVDQMASSAVKTNPPKI